MAERQANSPIHLGGEGALLLSELTHSVPIASGRMREAEEHCRASTRRRPTRRSIALVTALPSGTMRASGDISRSAANTWSTKACRMGKSEILGLAPP